MSNNNDFLVKIVRKVLSPLPDSIRWSSLARISPDFAEELGGFSELPDRKVLKSVVFPYLVQQEEYKNILFVGCEWYTKNYEKFFSEKKYWTIEPDPNKRVFGAKNHIVGPLKDLHKHFQAGYFDVIVCNGVFFKGAMDTPEEAEPSFTQCLTHLRPGGLFILGWNNSPDYLPYPLEESYSLKQFESYSFPPLSTSVYSTNTSYGHTYSFFIRPLATESNETYIPQVDRYF